MAEPILLDDAKIQCRVIDDDSEDALIEGYIAAAREWVENYTGHVLVQREIIEQRDSFGSFIELHRRPIIGVSGIDYIDTDGAAQSYADAVYQLDRFPARILPAVDGAWPPTWRYGGVTVSYTAGYDEGEEPQALLQAMLLLTAHWYKNREAVTANQPFEVPLAVTSLCDQFRAPGL